MKSIKYIAMLLFWILRFKTQAQHKLIKLWESDTTLAVPESVLPVTGGLYVSLVDGQALEVDGKGGIAKLDRNGRIIQADWVTGLNAPKGMCIRKSNLYVTDISEVHVIDTLTGKTVTRIVVPGAKGLNDMTIDERGMIYVSDSELGNIYIIKNNKPALYLRGLPGANGLKAVGDDLLIVTNGRLVKATKKGQIVTLAVIPDNGVDGLAPINDGQYLYSVYTGQIYLIDKHGTSHLLLNTEPMKQYSADFGYDPSLRTIYVPTLFYNSVTAYQLQ